MRACAGLLLCIVSHAWTVNANVEKTVFLGPSPETLPNVHPSLDDLRLDTLEPAQTSILATQLPVQFPSESAPHGLDSWYLLQRLDAGRRYEVRICWPATVSLPSGFFALVVPLSRVCSWPWAFVCLCQHALTSLLRSNPPTFG